MTAIRINSTPPGDAPLAVRQSWIGLTLPLIDPKQSEPRRFLTYSILEPHRRPSWFKCLKFKLGLLREGPIWEGYAVIASDSIDILAERNPEAAAWWRREAPWTLAPHQGLVFPTACCEVLMP